MLEVRDLHVRYGPVSALRGIDLEVQEGEAVGVIGPNGAGKTSALASIVGLVRPQEGVITLDGNSLAGRAPEDVVREGVALVPEGRQIFGTLTVGENLWLSLMSRGDERGDWDLERIHSLFPVLEDYERTPASKLSGGEQQQLAIARALLLNPRLLLLDEPSLGLAPRMVSLVFEILERLRNEGVTILLVEQVVARTIAFADRTYVLRNGQIQMSGSRDEIRQSETLSDAYMGFGDQ